jgi:hypothetical protein
MYLAKKICMEGGKIYYPGMKWLGEGVPSEKNFSIAADREGPKRELPPEPEEDFSAIDYFILIQMGKDLGITKKMKKAELIAAIREARKARRETHESDTSGQTFQIE